MMKWSSAIRVMCGIIINVFVLKYLHLEIGFVLLVDLDRIFLAFRYLPLAVFVYTLLICTVVLFVFHAL